MAVILSNASDYLDTITIPIPPADAEQCCHPSVIDMLSQHGIPRWSGHRYWLVGTSDELCAQGDLPEGLYLWASNTGETNSWTYKKAICAGLCESEDTTTGDGAGDGTTVICSSIPAGFPDDSLIGYEAVITSGDCAGEHRIITDYDQASRTITVSSAFSGQIVSGVDFQYYYERYADPSMVYDPDNDELVVIGLLGPCGSYYHSGIYDGGGNIKYRITKDTLAVNEVGVVNGPYADSLGTPGIAVHPVTGDWYMWGIDSPAEPDGFWDTQIYTLFSDDKGETWWSDENKLSHARKPCTVDIVQDSWDGYYPWHLEARFNRYTEDTIELLISCRPVSVGADDWGEMILAPLRTTFTNPTTVTAPLAPDYLLGPGVEDNWDDGGVYRASATFYRDGADIGFKVWYDGFSQANPEIDRVGYTSGIVYEGGVEVVPEEYLETYIYPKNDALIEWWSYGTDWSHCWAGTAEDGGITNTGTSYRFENAYNAWDDDEEEDYTWIDRWVMNFDLTGLPSGANIVGTEFSFYATSINGAGGANVTFMRGYSAGNDMNDPPVLGDYTAYNSSYQYVTHAMTSAGWKSDYFPQASTFISDMNTAIAGDGIFPVTTKLQWDLANTPGPAGGEAKGGYVANASNSTYKPRIKVFYKQPNLVATQIDSAGCNLDWTAYWDTFDHYEVARKTSAGVTRGDVIGDDIGTNSWEDTTADPDTDYYYKVYTISAGDAVLAETTDIGPVHTLAEGNIIPIVMHHHLRH